MDFEIRRCRSFLRSVAACVFFALSLFDAAALGQKEPRLEKAAGLEDWEHAFDISALPKGKYNIVVEGRDKAGNAAVFGPINVYVDPDSDLPRVSIVNPLPGMRVGGDLNVVGTCVDDDAVGYVEVSVDGGEFVRAEGGEFWSLLLATKNLADGRRTVAARGVDVNGLAGPVSRVFFDLDRAKPLAAVEGRDSGSLVSGSVRLQGSVYDANGVALLEASLDGGKTFSRLELRRGKDKERAGFTLPLDTRKFPDGPLVVWLKSVDGVGSRGSAAFVLVVDNTKPLIEIALPRESAAVNGRFTLAGAVRDAVGVARLSYEFAGVEKGEIPLVPGDPYFAKELDARALKGGKAEVTLIAEDRIGNVTRRVVTRRIDNEADKPVVRLSFPELGGKVGPGALVWGTIRDDDGVASLRYAIDGGAPVEIPASEHFAFVLPELPSGRHTLTLAAKDVEGRLGDPLVVPFLVDAGPAFVSFTRISPFDGKGGGESERDYAPGAEVRIDRGLALDARVLSPNPIAVAEWSVNGGPPRSLPSAKSEGGAYSYRLPLDRSLPYGFLLVELRVKDTFGNETAGKALLYAVNLGAIREEPGFIVDDPRLIEGMIRLSAKEDFSFAFYGEELAALRLEPESDRVAASFEGRIVTVLARAEGRTKPTKIIGTTKRGHVYETGPYVFDCDASPPRIEIDSPADGAWFKGRFDVRGRVTDIGGAVSLRMRLGTTQDEREVKVGSDGRFSLMVEPPPTSGPAILELVAEDPSGNRSRAYRSYGVDADPPELRFISPEAGADLRGPEDVAALVAEVSGVALVEFAADGENFAPIEHRPEGFIHRADLAANPKAAYRVTDRAGNVTLARPQVVIANSTASIPALSEVAIAPGEGEGRAALLGTSGQRKVALTLPALAEPEFLSLGFAEDRDPPERFSRRLLVSGSLSLSGKVSGRAPLKAVSLSLDGGTSYAPLYQAKDAKSALPEVAVKIAYDSTKAADGEARFVIRLEDVEGSALFVPLYLFIDNTAPRITFLAPDAGFASSGGPLLVVAKIVDGRGVLTADLVLGAERRALPVSEGGAYYAAWADPRPGTGQKNSLFPIALSARDEAGNAASDARRLSYDPQIDTPRIELSLPPSNPPAQGKISVPPKIAPGDAIVGSATDDDGPVPVSLSFDAAEPVLFPLGAFALPCPELAPGRHTLKIVARDALGAEAIRLVELFVCGPAPTLRDVEAVVGSSRAPWSPGAEIALSPGASLVGRSDSPNGLSLVEFSVNGGAAQKAAVTAPKEGEAKMGGTYSFSVPLPAALPFERFTVDVVARDGIGLETRRRYDFHAILPTLASAHPADDAEGLRFNDARISMASGVPRIDVAPGERLIGRWNGRPLRSVALEPASSLLEAAFADRAVSIDARAEGIALVSAEGKGGLKLVLVTVDGDRFEWGPFSACVDASLPVLTLEGPEDALWTKGATRVWGRAEDPNGVVAVELAVNGGQAELLAPRPASKAPLPAAGRGQDTPAIRGASPGISLPVAPQSPSQPPRGPLSLYHFDIEAALTGAEDGVVRLDIIARDAAGKESRITRFLYKDSAPPELSLVLPPPNEPVNGTTTLVGEARDGGRLASAVFVPSSDATAESVEGLSVFSRRIDLARIAYPFTGGGFRVKDRAGNEALLSPELLVDKGRDAPLVQVLAPAELEVVRQDFSVSGTALDDDGVAALWWRLDGGAWTRIEPTGAGFDVRFSLAATEDNERLFEIFAEDIYGVKGEVAARRFRVSREEPVARMTSPSIDKPRRGLVRLEGDSTDANGIASVGVSFDNVTSFDLARGAEFWSYPLDTRVLSDGLHAIAVKPVDRYDTEGFYATILGVDNTPPRAELSLPEDGELCYGRMLASGRVSDNVGLASARIEIAPIGRDKPPLLSIDLGAARVVRRELDLSSLPPGGYSVRLIARDRADNETMASRDIVLASSGPLDSVDILFPSDGERVRGRARVHGRARIEGGASTVTLFAGGVDLGSAPLDERGYFSFELPAERLAEGEITLVARVVTSSGRLVESRGVPVTWYKFGPWVSIDSHAFGAYLPYRPYLEGSAGYAAPDGEAPAGAADRTAVLAARKAAEGRRVARVEVSLDNGRTFTVAQGREKWRFRLETQNFLEGPVPLIVRAHFVDGSAAVVKTLFALDKTAPVVGLDQPAEDGRFNGEIRASGVASDASGLSAVGLSLRKGDKRSYELPSFIQGLYLDAHFMGATYYDLGAGLSFFQDNVKLQVMYGSAPELNSDGTPGRFYGDVFGAKLLANLAYLPAAFILGPDWDFLSASLAVGANFSYFTQTSSGTGLILGAVVAQVEFPKVTLKHWPLMRKYSFYGEGQAWFVSSDVQGGIEYRISFGARIGVF